MNKNLYFESERLLFNGITEQDAEILVKWLSDTEIIRYFKNPKSITKEDHVKWYFDTYVKNNERFDYIITERNSMQKIGRVCAVDINKSNQSCEIACMIGEVCFHRKGFASEAISALMSFMRQHQIYNFSAEIHKDNQASIRTFEGVNYVFDSMLDSFGTYVCSHTVSD